MKHRRVRNRTKNLFCTILLATMLSSIIVGAGIATSGRTHMSTMRSNGGTLSITTENGTFTISTVSGLEAKANGDDSILLDWEAVAGATGYAVYIRSIDKNGQFKLYSRVTSSGCIINDLTGGTAYEFKVAAYVAVNDKNYEGNAQTVSAVTQPKAVKLDLSGEGSSAKLKWSESGNADGYEIYKSANGGDCTLLKTVSGDTTSFEDSGLESGTEYSYKVRAKRTFGGADYYSDYSSASLTTDEATDESSGTVELEAPSFSLSTSGSGELTISWSKTSDNPDGYEIRYSSSQNGTYTTLVSQTDTSYTTDEFTSGSTYYFKVFAYKYGSNSEKYMSSSEVASITIGGEATAVEQANESDSGTDSDTSSGSSSSGSSGSSDSYSSDNGDTYIKISIDEQHMWFYKDGELLVSTDVVTGTLGVNDTPRGTYYIISKQSPAVLMEDSHVTYWMPFTYSGCGIHDAWWRYGEFGGDIYKTAGSHGCVNTPYDEVEIIYNNVSVGTTVIVE